MSHGTMAQFMEEVMRLMPSIMRGMLKRDGAMLAKGEVTLSQTISLELINGYGMLKMKDLAKELNISLPAATGLINKLYASKMVERVYDEKDRRVIYVKLTDKGKKTIEHFKSKKKEFVENVFSKLTEEERQSYLNILRKMKTIVSSENGHTIKQ